MSGPDADLAYTYDGSLLLSEAWHWSGGGTTAVVRGYDDFLEVRDLQVGAQPAVDFTYDGDGLLVQAGDLEVNRRAVDGLLATTNIGVVEDTWSFSGFAELEAYTAEVSGVPIFEVTYERDALGRIVVKNEVIAGQAKEYAYAYDPAGRLWRVEEDGVLVAEYTYDANGNRLAYETPGGTTTYEYDARGNLRSVALPDSTEIEYLVDGRNRRVGRKVDGVVEKRWVYKDQLNPVAELDASGNIVAEYVYATKANVPDLMITATATYRIISDHLGSVRLVIDTTTGTVAHRMDYDEFGNVLVDTNPGFQLFGFAGGIYDADTEFVRFGTRDYGLKFGRWSAKDSIRFAGGDANIYAYVLQDPINLIDTTGRGPNLALGVGVICELAIAVGSINSVVNVPGINESILQSEKLLKKVNMRIDEALDRGENCEPKLLEAQAALIESLAALEGLEADAGSSFKSFAKQATCMILTGSAFFAPSP